MKQLLLLLFIFPLAYASQVSTRAVNQYALLQLNVIIQVNATVCPEELQQHEEWTLDIEELSSHSEVDSRLDDQVTLSVDWSATACQGMALYQRLFPLTTSQGQQQTRTRILRAVVWEQQKKEEKHFLRHLLIHVPRYVVEDDPEWQPVTRVEMTVQSKLKTVSAISWNWLWQLLSWVGWAIGWIVKCVAAMMVLIILIATVQRLLSPGKQPVQPQRRVIWRDPIATSVSFETVDYVPSKGMYEDNDNDNKEEDEEHESFFELPIVTERQTPSDWSWPQQQQEWEETNSEGSWDEQYFDRVYQGTPSCWTNEELLQELLQRGAAPSQFIEKTAALQGPDHFYDQQRQYTSQDTMLTFVDNGGDICEPEGNSMSDACMSLLQLKTTVVQQDGVVTDEDSKKEVSPSAAGVTCQLGADSPSTAPVDPTVSPARDRKKDTNETDGIGQLDNGPTLSSLDPPDSIGTGSIKDDVKVVLTRASVENNSTRVSPSPEKCNKPLEISNELSRPAEAANVEPLTTIRPQQSAKIESSIAVGADSRAALPPSNQCDILSVTRQDTVPQAEQSSYESSLVPDPDREDRGEQQEVLSTPEQQQKGCRASFVVPENLSHTRLLVEREDSKLPVFHSNPADNNTLTFPPVPVVSAQEVRMAVGGEAILRPDYAPSASLLNTSKKWNDSGSWEFKGNGSISKPFEILEIPVKIFPACGSKKHRRNSSSKQGSGSVSSRESQGFKRRSLRSSAAGNGSNAKSNSSAANSKETGKKYTKALSSRQQNPSTMNHVKEGQVVKKGKKRPLSPPNSPCLVKRGNRKRKASLSGTRSSKKNGSSLHNLEEKQLKPATQPIDISADRDDFDFDEDDDVVRNGTRHKRPSFASFSKPLL